MTWFIKYNNTPNTHGFGRIPDPPEPPDQEPELQVGDWIECRDKEDMVDAFQSLMDEDIETDFRYEHNGVKGLWLEVIAVG